MNLKKIVILVGSISLAYSAFADAVSQRNVFYTSPYDAPQYSIYAAIGSAKQYSDNQTTKFDTGLGEGVTFEIEMPLNRWMTLATIVGYDIVSYKQLVEEEYVYAGFDNVPIIERRQYYDKETHFQTIVGTAIKFHYQLPIPVRSHIFLAPKAAIGPGVFSLRDRDPRWKSRLSLTKDDFVDDSSALPVSFHGRVGVRGGLDVFLNKWFGLSVGYDVTLAESFLIINIKNRAGSVTKKRTVVTSFPFLYQHFFIGLKLNFL